ncbi:MAG: hypothetical protein ACPLRW_13080 [Moorellales bacterium]
MAAVSPQELVQKWESGVGQVTYQDYCAKQEALGVRADVCRARFENYKRRVAGKGQKFLTRWQGGA